MAGLLPRRRFRCYLCRKSHDFTVKIRGHRLCFKCVEEMHEEAKKKLADAESPPPTPGKPLFEVLTDEA